MVPLAGIEFIFIGNKGPPAYFTVDWQAVKTSIETLKNLKPAFAISSHGLPMAGDELKQQLENLVKNYEIGRSTAPGMTITIYPFQSIKDHQESLSLTVPLSSSLSKDSNICIGHIPQFL